MKTTDWYTRLMLSIIAGSLMYLAATLRTATQEAAAFYARVPQGTPAGSVALPAAWRTPAQEPGSMAQAEKVPPTTINVRLIGYQFDGESFDFGDDYSYLRPGLPICQSDKR